MMLKSLLQKSEFNSWNEADFFMFLINLMLFCRSYLSTHSGHLVSPPAQHQSSEISMMNVVNF